MQKKLLVLCLLTLGLLVGCSGFGTSGQRLDALEESVSTAQVMLGKIDVNIAQLEAGIEQTKELLAAVDLDPELQAKLEEALDKTEDVLGEALEHKADVQVALASWQAEIEDIRLEGTGIGAEISAIGAGIKTVGGAFPAPVGPWASLVGMGLLTVGSLWKNWSQKNALGKSRSVAKSLTGTVGILLKDAPDLAAAVAKIKEQQKSDGTRTAIRRVIDGD